MIFPWPQGEMIIKSNFTITYFSSNCNSGLLIILAGKSVLVNSTSEILIV